MSEPVFEGRALSEAYSLLRNSTPLGKGDCGRLCGGACCKGGEGDGMLLFPGEEKLFEGREGFDIIDCGAHRLLVCRGSCTRSERPLACRLFPLFPLVYEDGGELRLEVVRDPRFGMCPLNKCDIRLDSTFVRRVRLAGRYLMREEQHRDYLLRVSLSLLEMLDLRSKLGDMM